MRSKTPDELVRATDTAKATYVRVLFVMFSSENKPLHVKPSVEMQNQSSTSTYAAVELCAIKH